MNNKITTGKKGTAAKPNYGKLSFKERLFKRLRNEFASRVSNTPLQFKAYPSYWHFALNKKKNIDHAQHYLTQNLFHQVGGHVFNSRNQAVLDWFWGHFDQETEFIKTQRNAKILMNNSLIGYPIENYIYQLSEDKLLPIINEILDKLSDNQITPKYYQNFKEFLIGNFGKKLYELYFGPYNIKIWHTDLESVPLAWLDGKLPMPNLRDVILSNVVKKEEASMVHASFFYPKRDGSQLIVYLKI